MSSVPGMWLQVKIGDFGLAKVMPSRRVALRSRMIEIGSLQHFANCVQRPCSDCHDIPVHATESDGPQERHVRLVCLPYELRHFADFSFHAFHGDMPGNQDIYCTCSNDASLDVQKYASFSLDAPVRKDLKGTLQRRECHRTKINTDT